MNRTKRIIAPIIILAIILLLSACSEGNVSHTGEFTIEQIQDDPNSFLGEITLSGIVGNSITQDFALNNGAGTFLVNVDYRGSQALPQIGDKIIAHGQLSENRPCCGPGFTLRSTRFEVVE